MVAQKISGTNESSLIHLNISF